MIDFLRGEIAEVEFTRAVLDVAGVGYELNITLPDYELLKDEKTAKLFVHEAIREDAHILYGFSDRAHREWFRLLIGVSGVGPGTARLILSTLRGDELEQCISSGDSLRLKSVKGVGAKTAERIIVDLRDKINKGGAALIATGGAPNTEQATDALNALIMLGFAAPQARKAIVKVTKESPDLSTEAIIRAAIKLL